MLIIGNIIYFNQTVRFRLQKRYITHKFLLLEVVAGGGVEAWEVPLPEVAEVVAVA